MFFGQVFLVCKVSFSFLPFLSHPSSPLSLYPPSSFLPTLFLIHRIMFAPRIAAPLRNVGRVQGNAPLPARSSATTTTTKHPFPSPSIDALSLASGISLGENRLASDICNHMDRHTHSPRAFYPAPLPNASSELKIQSYRHTTHSISSDTLPQSSSSSSSSPSTPSD